MRHEKLPRAVGRPVTPRRLQRTEHALRREQAMYPLLAAQIADEQPTPAERIARHEADHVAYWQRIRDHAAQTWKAARKIVASLPADQREDLLRQWQDSPCPARAGYFADFVWHKTGRSASNESDGRSDAE